MEMAEPATSEEDDYMSMIIGEPEKKPIRGSYVEQVKQKQRETERAASQKSKAQLKAEEDASSRSALEQPLEPSNKGFQLLQKLGYKPGEALGKAPSGASVPASQDADEQRPHDAARARRDGPAIEPIRISMPQGRSGIGIEEAKKRKLDEEVEREMKRVRVDQDTYRERMRAEREESRNEALVSAAQKVAERLAEVKWQAEHEDAVLEGRVLVPRVANVLWRGKVQRREQQEKEKRLRHDMASNLLRRGSLAREDEDEEEDEDDRIALGKTVQEIEDPDDEDQELEEFEALLAAEKLQRLIDHLRSEHYYCFWCKYQYEDSDMEGCPGKTEEDHD